MAIQTDRQTDSCKANQQPQQQQQLYSPGNEATFANELEQVLEMHDVQAEEHPPRRYLVEQEPTELNLVHRI